MISVCLAAPISEDFHRLLISKGNRLVSWEDVQHKPQELETLRGIITSNKLRLNAALLKKLPSLQWIARLGSGMEIIDTDYCRQQGILCFSSPAGIASSVAEHLTGMLLSLLHHIPSSHQEVIDGKWIREPNRGHELSKLKLGIIGYGHTGKAFAKRIQCFTSPIWVYDKYLKGFASEGILEVDLATLQQEADIVSFHVPLNQETHHYYDASFSSAMKKPHRVLNTSRGEVVSTEALLQGFEQGRVLGACLDVVEAEAQVTDQLMDQQSSLRKLFNYPLLITPHIAGYSFEAIEAMSEELMQQLTEAGFLC